MSDFNPILDKRKDSLPAYKLAVFQYGIVAILVVLIFGLWRLQVVGAQNYRALAEANRVRKVPILAARGQIFDREGRLIVDNYPSVSCFLVREQGHDLKPDLPLIARGLHMTLDQIDAIIHKYRTAPKYQPIPLKEDITPDEQEFIAAHADEMPELETIEEQRRLYPKDGFAAHLIGYVGEVSEQMLNNDPRYAFYEPGDVVGRSGVEESYDSILRGQDGSHDVLVDSRGREVGSLGTEPSVPGKSLRLTIDLDIQRAAENAMGDRDGAIVALDPHTGEVLAMVSRPTFDPNQFSVHISHEEWNKLLTDPEHPLLNKAIQAMSPPGSTFKIVMTLAGLQQGIAQDLKVNCQGGASFYGHFYACDRHHGEVDIHNALPYSCDTYYYTLAVKLGIDTIAKYAHEVGLGQKTGIDLPDEIPGVMPSTEWAMRSFHRKWYAGETVSVGIGQGAVAVTPIQLARTIGGIASGGVFKRPHVVFPSELPPEFHQAILDTYPGSGDKTIPIDPANWQIITDDMANVTQSPIGTAYSSRLADIDFAGKTGTAQVVSHSFGTNKVASDKSQRANAWFVGIAPRRNPDIVVVVFWQHGGWGTDSAHMAAQVIQAFVDKQRRLDHNLVAQQPGQSSQKPDTQKPQKIDVGAIWSIPGNPNIFGGKPLVTASGRSGSANAKSGKTAGPQLASARAGHFYLTIPAAPPATAATPLTASASSTLAEVVH
jgi:penicillin-binding protein 2